MSAQPALNLTPATGGLIVANLAVHLLRLALSPTADRALLVNFGFAPSLFLGPHGAIGPAEALTWVTPLSYSFLHGDFLHLLVNTGFLLAFGTLVERRLGALRFLAFYLVMAVLSVTGTTLMYLVTGAPVLIIGASGGVAGLFGAAARFAFQPSRPSLVEAMAPRRRQPNRGFLLGVMFIGLNLLFGLIGFADFGGLRAIAWEAHVAGFLFGAALFPLFAARTPGGQV